MSSDKPSRTLSRQARETALLHIGAAMPIIERAYRSRANHALAHVGVSQAMAFPLLLIGRQGDGIRPGGLAELLGIEGPSLTRTLDQLVEAGFIERRDDPGDRRAKTLHLTEAGRAACDQLEATLRVLRNEIYEAVDDADVEATLRVFAALQQKLGCPSPIVPPRRK